MSEPMVDFDGIVDLTDRDESVGKGDFEAAPSGQYECTVDDADWVYVQNDGAYPAGTPGLNVRFRVSLDEEDRKGVKVANKCFFNTFWIPPTGHDPEKARKAKGALVNFLKSAGITDEQLSAKKFNLDDAKDEIVGNEVAVVVGKKTNDYHDPPREENPVMGVKPAGSVAGKKSAASVL